VQGRVQIPVPVLQKISEKANTRELGCSSLLSMPKALDSIHSTTKRKKKNSQHKSHGQYLKGTEILKKETNEKN
jgi:hypothetical protein